MTFKIVIFAAVVLACQVNAQVGGFIRPFATGFTNGITEMAKPFVQLGQTIMAPAAPGRRPPMTQWMSYPSQIVPQVQGAYEGFEAVASGVPGVSYFQVVRPNQGFKPPQMPYYPISAGQPGLMIPPRPYPAPAPVPAPAPAPAPASSSSEESDEDYRPSSLLIDPESAEVEVQVPEAPMTVEGNVDIPALQRPLPVVEDRK